MRVDVISLSKDGFGKGAADATRGTRSERGEKESGSKWEPLQEHTCGERMVFSEGGRAGEAGQLSKTFALP